MTPSDWAAWVQAIGAMLAIGISIAFWRSDVSERRQRERRSQAALAAYIRKPVDDMVLFLETLRGSKDDDVRQYGAYRGDHQHIYGLKIPARLEKARSMVDALGTLGPDLHAFVVYLANISSIATALCYGDRIPGRREELLAELASAVDNAKKHGNALQAAIEESVKV